MKSFFRVASDTGNDFFAYQMTGRELLEKNCQGETLSEKWTDGVVSYFDKIDGKDLFWKKENFLTKLTGRTFSEKNGGVETFWTQKILLPGTYSGKYYPLPKKNLFIYPLSRLLDEIFSTKFAAF